MNTHSTHADSWKTQRHDRRKLTSNATRFACYRQLEFAHASHSVVTRQQIAVAINRSLRTVQNAISASIKLSLHPALAADYDSYAHNGQTPASLTTLGPDQL